MRKRSFLLFTFAAAAITAGLFATPVRATDDSYSYARIVRLSYVSGDVQIVRADQSSKWEPAYANMPIQQGFTLGTNNGRAEVEFENGSALWLAENSILQFTELALSDGGRITKMTLAQGTASFEANLQAGDSFVVSTSQFQITPPVKSQFRVDAFREGGSVSVFAGKVSVTSDAGEKEVARGETFALNTNAANQTAVKNNPSRDGWDRWVNNRENYLTNGANQTLQYTNSPFSYGTADLSSYGSWNYYPGCGYGWQPFGMSSGWMPFLDGQWMFYPSFGWTWVSFEPWGWMPYHFGGWSDCGGFGWMWMPGGYGFWNAGPVQWIGNHGRLGWRPVPPRVNPVHAAAEPAVFSTKNLGKEGRYEVLPSSKLTNEMRELPGPPLSNGKVPGVGEVLGNAKLGSGRGAVVPTSASLTALRSQLASGSSTRGFVNEAAPPTATKTGAVPGAVVHVAVRNSAPPPPRMPSAPPVRTNTPAPSAPGQPSYRAPSAEPGRAAYSGAPAAHSSPAPAPAGGGAHPH